MSDRALTYAEIWTLILLGELRRPREKAALDFDAVEFRELIDRLEIYLDRCAVAEVWKGFAGVRRLYG
jgi:hypothetical protein